MTQNDNYYPAGWLVPIFAANEDLDSAATILSLAKSAAANGETVLVVDCQEGRVMDAAGIMYNKTLGDVLFRSAALNDAQYVTSNDHFTAMCAGDATMETLLGSLAAISLSYDWVFVATETGCTPAHIRLAGAADTSLLAYDTRADNFMRAYWMIDACRRRYPRFDPLLVSMGCPDDAIETAELLRGNISEFLGAAPPYAGHTCGGENIDTLLASLRPETAAAA